MTIQQAIDVIDALKPNMIANHQKVAWLNDLDGLVWREIYSTHDCPEGRREFSGYDEDTSFGRDLLVKAPYTDVYRHYMAAQMDIAHRETEEYAKDMNMFNAAWQTLCDYWSRTYPPVRKVHQLRF